THHPQVVLLSGQVLKLSKRSMWISRYFELVAVRSTTSPPTITHILGWSKKRNQSEYTASCKVEDINSIAVLFSARPIVYTPHNRRLKLKQEVSAEIPSVEVVSINRDADSSLPSTATEIHAQFDFRITLKERSDIVLRVA